MFFGFSAKYRTTFRITQFYFLCVVKISESCSIDLYFLLEASNHDKMIIILIEMSTAQAIRYFSGISSIFNETITINIIKLQAEKMSNYY